MLSFLWALCLVFLSGPFLLLSGADHVYAEEFTLYDVPKKKLGEDAWEDFDNAVGGTGVITLRFRYAGNLAFESGNVKYGPGYRDLGDFQNEFFLQYAITYPNETTLEFGKGLACQFLCEKYADYEDNAKDFADLGSLSPFGSIALPPRDSALDSGFQPTIERLLFQPGEVEIEIGSGVQVQSGDIAHAADWGAAAFFTTFKLNLYPPTVAPTRSLSLSAPVQALEGNKAAVPLQWPNTPLNSKNFATEKFIIYYVTTANTKEQAGANFEAEKQLAFQRLLQWKSNFPMHQCGPECQKYWGSVDSTTRLPGQGAIVSEFDCVTGPAYMHRAIGEFDWSLTQTTYGSDAPTGDQYNFDGILEGLSLPFAGDSSADRTEWLKSNYATSKNGTNSAGTDLDAQHDPAYPFENVPAGFCLDLDPELVLETGGVPTSVDGAIEHELLIGDGSCGANDTYSDCLSTLVSDDFVLGKHVYFTVLPVYVVSYFGAEYTFPSKLITGDISESANENVFLAAAPGQAVLSSLNILSSTELEVTWLLNATFPDRNGEPDLSFNTECNPDPNFDPSTKGYMVARDLGVVGNHTFTAPFILGASYYCRVWASNALGEGSKSAPVSILFVTVPDAPDAPSLTVVSSESMAVEFVLPSDGGDPAGLEEAKIEVSSDNVTFDDSLRLTGFNEPECITFGFGSSSLIVCTLLVDGLSDGLTYYVRVSVKNSLGYGEVSSVSSVAIPSAPTIATKSLRVDGQFIDQGAYHEYQGNTTSGGKNVTLSGTGFTAFGPTVVSMERCCGQPPLSPLAIVSVTNEEVVFELPAGVGTELAFTVASGAEVSAPSVDVVSYPAPQITDGTLRRPQGSPRTAGLPLPALTSLSESLLFDGVNFGSDVDSVSVTYTNGGGSVFNCEVEFVNDTQVQCKTTTSAGQQLDQVFTISVGEQTDVGTDIYNYPSLPDVGSVSGCSACDASAFSNDYTCDCPTAGETRLTFTGTKLSEPLNIIIGGKLCRNLSWLGAYPNAQAQCDLPSGTGFNKGVVFSQSSITTNPEPMVSYARPSVLSVTGCINGVDCQRKNPTDVVMVSGNDFGAEGARVYVGGKICQSTNHTLGSEQTELTCKMPEYFGQSLTVLVYQLEGEFSVEQDVTLSYDECDPGTFVDGFDCINCPIGSANDAFDQQVCPECSAGFFSNTSGLSECFPCLPGLYSESNASACTECPQGFFNDVAESPVCIPCAPGKSKAQDSSDVCQPCAAGFFQGDGGQTGCDACPPGKYSTEGSTRCIPCESGYAAPEFNSSTCTICGNGTYSERNSSMIENGEGPTRCLGCPMGTFNAFPGSSRCVPCESGFYANMTGSEICSACHPGFFSSKGQLALVGPVECEQCGNTSTSGAGSASCQSCSPGYFFEFPECKPCAKGFYQDEEGKEECKLCQPGRSSTEVGASVCPGCPVGSARSASDETGECSLCAPGRFQNETGQEDCMDCLSGRATRERGSVTCPECPVGTARSDTDPGDSPEVCPQCTMGYFAPSTGETSCTACSPGEFGNADGLTTCSDCTRGFFSTGAARECTECPGGSVSQQDRATSCETCETGTYAPAASFSCILCGVGRYSAGNQSECTLCPNGTSAPLTGSSTCTGCTAGQFAEPGFQQCLKCVSGTFSDQDAAGRCEQCQPGRFNDDSEQVDCKDCQPGRFANASGAKSCTSCPLGKYSGPQASECFQCEPGLYTVEKGSTRCLTCPFGTIVSAAQDGCVDTYYQEDATIYAFLGASGFGAVLVLVAALVFICFRDHREIRTAQPIFMYTAMIGFLFIFASSALWILDQTVLFCHLKNGFLNVGVGIVMLAIACKQWRVHKIFNHSVETALHTMHTDAPKQKKNESLALILTRLLPLVLVDIIICVLWYFIAPFTVEETVGRCDSKWEPLVNAPLWGWKVLVLMFLLWLTYQVKDVDSRFNESRWLELILYNWIITLALLIVVNLTMDLAPRILIILLVGTIVYLGYSTWMMVYCPKFWRVWKEDHEYDDLFGSSVASDISDAEDALEEQQEEEEEDLEDLKNNPTLNDPKIKKLIVKRHQKAEELEKKLKEVERNKQRMKVDVTTLNALSSDVLALNSEIEYRKKLLTKGGGSAGNTDAYATSGEIEVEQKGVGESEDTEMAALGKAEEGKGNDNARLSVPNPAATDAESGPPGLIDERPKDSISIATPSQLPRPSAPQEYGMDGDDEESDGDERI